MLDNFFNVKFEFLSFFRIRTSKNLIVMFASEDLMYDIQHRNKMNHQLMSVIRHLEFFLHQEHM
jgi:hypothetical protein